MRVSLTALTPGPFRIQKRWRIRTGGTDNQVQAALAVLEGLLRVVTDNQHLVRAQLLCIFILTVRRADGRHMRTHSFGKEQAKVAQPADPDDTDILGLAARTVFYKWRVYGDTTAEHGRSLGRVKVVGNGHGKVGGTTPVVGVSAKGLAAFCRAALEDAGVGASDASAAVRLVFCWCQRSQIPRSQIGRGEGDRETHATCTSHTPCTNRTGRQYPPSRLP